MPGFAISFYEIYFLQQGLYWINKKYTKNIQAEGKKKTVTDIHLRFDFGCFADIANFNYSVSELKQDRNHFHNIKQF